MPRWLLVTVILACLVGNIYLPGLHQQYFPKRDQGEAVLLEVVGESRLLMARYLWFKSDLYHEELDLQGVEHSQQSELLPLLRMVSLMDPQFVEAFDQIAYDLVAGHGLPQEALQIVDEGLEQNPDNGTLNFRKALILFNLARYEEAAKYGYLAFVKSNDEFEKLNSLRLAFHSAEEMGDREAEKRALELLLELRPDDHYFNQRWKELGF